MTTILDTIVASKKDDLPRLKREVPLSDLRKKSRDTEPARAFLNAFGRKEFNVIAEIKRASPSLGVIREDYQPVDIAYGYEEHGAKALSVLTDEKFFQGKLADLVAVKAAVKIPCLRKDFTVHEYHVVEARASGADAILLIAAVLDDHQLKDYQDLATELGMATLIEVHDAEELVRTLAVGPKLVGVNNRNLKDFKVDVQTSLDLIARIPADTVAISESGLKTRDDLIKLSDAGYDGFLIGETFMKEQNPGMALGRLLNDDPR